MTTWRVDGATGSDVNPGTVAQPWATIGKAIAMFNAGSVADGDVVGIVAGQTYTEHDLTPTRRAASTVRFTRVGSGVDPILDAATLGEGIHFNCSNVTLERVTVINATIGIAMEACNSVRVKACTIRDCDKGMDLGSKDGSGNGHDNVVELCKIYDIGGDAITTGTAYRFTIRWNHIYDIAVVVTDALADGIALHGSLDDWSEIYSNLIERVRGKSGIGLNLLGGVLGSKARIYGNLIIDTTHVPLAVAGGQGILTLGTSTVAEIYNNIVVMSATSTASNSGIAMTEGTCDAWNNTVYNRAAATGIYSFAATTAVDARNNVSCCTTTKGAHWYVNPSAVGTINSNLYYPDDTTADLPDGRFTNSVGFGQFVLWQAIGWDSVGTTGDPKFYGGDVDDWRSWRVKGTSAARGLGENLTAEFTDDYQGSARLSTGDWTVGALDYADAEIGQTDSKKLRIRSKALPSQIVVIQDGDAADGTATIKVDNGFRDGYASALTTTGAANRTMFRMKTLTATRQGRELVFEVQDFTNRNTFLLGVGDKVEFWCDNGNALPPQSGNWPSWHSALQEGQTKHFFGFIRDIRRSQDAGSSIFTVTAVDPIEWTNRIKLVQNFPDDVKIPRLIFNCDDIGDIDWHVAIKVYDDDEITPLDRYGPGRPLDATTSKMTAGEILDYLQAAYQSDLYDRSIIAGAGDDLFEASDLDALTDEPSKIVLENIGFGEGVRQILRAVAPDHDIFVDPRTQKWRIVATTRDIVAGAYTTATSVVITKLRWKLADVSGFATSGTGSTVRIQSATDPLQSEVRQVVAVDTVAKEIEVEYVTSYAFTTNDYFVPMYAESARPPELQVDLEAHCIDNTLVTDLTGVYSAVSIVAQRQKTTDTSISYTAGEDVAAKLDKGYDPSYETNFREETHRHRRSDRGIDGLGIVILEREQVDQGNGTFKTRVYFSEATSAHGNDHDILNNATGDGEWSGTSFHLLTTAATTLNIDSSNVTAIIERFSRSGWADAAQTIRRFAVLLDRNVLATAPDMKAQITDATTGDRFEMTSSEIYKPKNPNRRSMVGRSAVIVSTTADDDARNLGAAACPAMVDFQGQNGQPQTTSATPIGRNTDAPRSFQELKDYHGLNPGINGMPLVWELKPVDRNPGQDFASLCAKVPPPAYVPPTLSLSVERYTNEVRSVRVPEAGFNGLSWLWHKHAEELYLPSDRFEDDSQGAQFELIAAAIWRRVSEPRYSGELKLRGLSPWLRMIDLGFRVGFGAGDTGIVNGAVTEQSRFWGLVESITYDMEEGTAALSFASTSESAEVSQLELFERLFVSETAEMRELKERERATEKLARCVANRPSTPSPQVQPGCNVSHSGQTILRKTSVIDPKETFIGGGETNLGTAPPTGGAAASVDPSSNLGSMAFNPAFVIERDYLGRPFAVTVPGGSMMGGTETGSRFIRDTSQPVAPTLLPQYTADALDELAQAFLGVDLQTPAASITVELGAGSTTTVLKLAQAIPNDGRFAGGFIEFRSTGTARPKYTISTHTNDAVTLTGAMSESVPAQGSQATIWAARLPALNSSDFPDGGRPFKDQAGSWFVATGGRIIPATLASSTLSKASGAAPSVKVLTTDWFNRLTVPWEKTIFFADANVGDDGGGGVIDVSSDILGSAYNQALVSHRWSDGLKEGAYFAFRVPKHLDPATSLTVLFIATLSGAVGSETIEIQIAARATAPSENHTSGGTTMAKASGAFSLSGYSASTMIDVELSAAFGAGDWTPGDLIHGVIYRDPSSANDNFGGAVQAVGMVVTGSARLISGASDGERIGGEDGADSARLLTLAG